METQFKLEGDFTLIDNLSTKWQAPSNIALVKYWGKYGMQLPANPSISFTLNACRTITTVTASKGTHDFSISYDGTPKPEFAPKIEAYFKRIADYCPWIANYHFDIDTHNTFPHSSGIASSASSMAAMSVCMMDFESTLTGQEMDFHKASFLARLGSGSACRSLKGSAVVWGTHKEVDDSSQYFGVDKSDYLHPVFQDFQDTILLVDKGEKVVSSTVGHELMNGHAFAKARFEQAHENLSTLKKALQEGDLETFIKITESEALTLHAMMMTSHPYFILMKPKTLSIIEEIWAFKKETGIPVCFTLDAGANVHMLYPHENNEAVQGLINSKLAQYCQNGHYICDQVGTGAKKC
ncbi:diphosphomevalonate/mevalonate 3,5-bisphosphate decarboxylase family protein [Nonlabens ulvanivorans]|uniref:diphosphomevalonate/mevalonate 3,5-bisphosphate decarboxylase family protein n=1 Tax=Nonlabens ulvanivorans TaxID=906888 RepID=UPI002943B010|nr:diphosphomevalonate decarboxylase [Nonlabens ulvanivorans]WOI22741.1 diphosphomevalonate decarboxylase [Nonlabens ulvanivorans]